MSENVLFSQRLDSLLKEKKITLSKLAELTNFSRAYISMLKKGRHKNLNLKTACKICDVLGVPLETLFDQEYKSITKFVTVNRFAPILKWEDVKSRIRHGELMQSIDDVNFVPAPVTTNNDCFALQIDNDAMESHDGGFNVGDYVLIKPTDKIENGDFIVCDTPIHTTPILRQYFEEGGKIILKPLNKRHKITYIEAPYLLTIHGVVVEKRIVIKK